VTAALAPIVAVLERAIGMAVGSVGPRAVEAAVRRRLDATGVPDLAAYLDRLRADRQEQAELVDAVIVPETWFFRYPDSFRHLATWAVTRPEKPNPLRPLRVLCVPCCTGEEPYSAAAALVDAGLPADAVRVDGVDVSRRLVEYAAAGVYGEPAFRETPADVRGRHFAPAGGGTFAVRPAVKAAVRFRAGNLADPKLLAGEPAYHAVFCRNLFIYLTDAARRTAVATLDRLLAPDGVIYMGHAEPLGLMDARFRSVGPPQAFAFTRTPVEGGGGGGGGPRRGRGGGGPRRPGGAAPRSPGRRPRPPASAPPDAPAGRPARRRPGGGRCRPGRRRR
jgi:chemotaxis protein methyltransferase WspC